MQPYLNQIWNIYRNGYLRYIFQIYLCELIHFRLCLDVDKVGGWFYAGFYERPLSKCIPEYLQFYGRSWWAFTFIFLNLEFFHIKYSWSLTVESQTKVYSNYYSPGVERGLRRILHKPPPALQASDHRSCKQDGVNHFFIYITSVYLRSVGGKPFFLNISVWRCFCKKNTFIGLLLGFLFGVHSPWLIV